MYKDLFYNAHKQTTKFDIEVIPFENGFFIKWNDENGLHEVCFDSKSGVWECWECWEDKISKEDVFEAFTLWLLGVEGLNDVSEE